MTARLDEVVALQRYTPALNDSEYMDGTQVASMDPYTEGRFVLYSDHEAALQSTNARLAAVLAALKMAHTIILQEVKGDEYPDAERIIAMALESEGAANG